MVTPAGKELLKNTINTVKHHNRLLEESEMWRHWNLEKGLTMMVSDDLFRAEKSLDVLLKKKRKKKKHKEHKERKEQRKRDKHNSWESGHSSSHSSKTDSVKVASSSADRWDHSGFEELYPESKPALKSDSSDLKRSFKETFKKYKPPVNNASPSTYSDSSDSKEVWEEFKLSKKRRREDSSSDRVRKSRRCDNGDDFDQRIGNKHKNDGTTLEKKDDCKKCVSRHCHHKHEKRAKYVSCRYS